MTSPRVIARIAVVAIGVWLEAAPAVLAYGSPAADVDRVLGPIAAGVAFVAIWPVVDPVRWATVPVGVLLTVAPLLGYPADAAVSSTSSGIAIIALAFVGGTPDQRFGGGWRAVAQSPALPDGRRMRNCGGR